jgi:hypothetical protein
LETQGKIQLGMEKLELGQFCIEGKLKLKQGHMVWMGEDRIPRQIMKV